MKPRVSKPRVSLKTRLLAYLKAHPGAELSRSQIMETFCAGEKYVDQTLTEMRRDGLVETVHVTRLPKDAECFDAAFRIERLEFEAARLRDLLRNTPREHVNTLKPNAEVSG